MAQFTLRTLLLLTALVAGVLSLLVLGGWGVVNSTLIVGLVIGGCVSFLFRRSALGGTPVVFALAAAIVSEILGIYLVDFHIEDWDNPLGKTPSGLYDLFWYAFFGALAGAAFGAAIRIGRRLWANNRQHRS